MVSKTFVATFKGKPASEPWGTKKNMSGKYYDYRTKCTFSSGKACNPGDYTVAWNEEDDCLITFYRNHCLKPTSTIDMGQVGGKGYRPHPTDLGSGTVTIGNPYLDLNGHFIQKYDLDKIQPSDWDNSAYLNVKGPAQDLYPHLSGPYTGTMYQAWLTRYCDKGDHMGSDPLCGGTSKGSLDELKDKCKDPTKFTREECIDLLSDNNKDQGGKAAWDTAIQNYCNEHPEKDACACMNQVRKKWTSPENGHVPWCAKPGNEDMPGCKLINQDYNAMKDLPMDSTVKSSLIAGLSCRKQECDDGQFDTNLLKVNNPITQCDDNQQFCIIMNNEIKNANIKAGEKGIDMSCDQTQTTNSGDSSSTNNNTTTSTFFGSGDSVFVNKDGSFPMITFVLIGIIVLLVLVILFTLLGGTRT